MSKNRGTYKKKIGSYRNGTTIAKLEFADVEIFPRVFDKTVAKTTEKQKIALMIDKLRTRSNLSDEDIIFFRQQFKEKEKRDFAEMIEDAKKMQKNRVEWTRDERGRIISPFSKKSKNF